MILNDGTDWEPEDEDVLRWQQLYPAVDVFQELRAMEGWLDANPTKRKTPRGVKRFVNSWLARAQDRGGSPQQFRSSEVTGKTRDMTQLDDLSHNFTDDPAITKHMIERYGQCFIDGRRVTA